MAARDVLPEDAFIDLPLATVLKIENQAAEDLQANRLLSSYSDQGKSVSKAFAAPPGLVLKACQYAKRAIDPDTYGLNRQRRRVHGNFCNNTEL